MKTLVTDLDGTFLPLATCAENPQDLLKISHLLDEHALRLVFASGRHFASILRAIDQFATPTPDLIIANVGSEIYNRVDHGEMAEPTHPHALPDLYELEERYADHLTDICAGTSVRDLRRIIDSIQGLELQEPEKQGPFKLSYYCAAHNTDSLHSQLEQSLAAHSLKFSVVSSVDPFDDRGLIDILPFGVNKSYAIQWWYSQQNLRPDDIIYAGDSGNDLHALAAGYAAILVGNATDALSNQLRELHLAQFQNEDQLFLATKPATSGVLEGLKHYLKRKQVEHHD